MYPRRRSLNEEDQALYRAISAFLGGRLMERETIAWALKSDKHTPVKRLVIRDLIEDPYRGAKDLVEPWRSTWELIIESWSISERAELGELNVIHIQKRLQSGERSASLADAIVGCFTPRLEIREPEALSGYRERKRPKTIGDLLSLDTSSGSVHELRYVSIDAIDDISFLSAIARDLEVSIQRGLDIARRIGWGTDSAYWLVPMIRSVAYRSGGDPDEYARGMHASVKLFHTVVDRLAKIDTQKASVFIKRWRNEPDPLNSRLWASFAHRSSWIDPGEVGSFLLGLDDRTFWESSGYPEIAELRAVRFAELTPEIQETLWARIRQLPPRGRWSRRFPASEERKWRYRVVVVESKRIEGEGNNLPPVHIRWLKKVYIEYPEFEKIERISSPYQERPIGEWVGPSPDMSFDSLAGHDRLSAIEKALTKDERRSGVHDWLGLKDRVLYLIDDISAATKPIWEYPRTWEQICSEHRPSDELYGPGSARNRVGDFRIVLSFLKRTPDVIIKRGIRAFSDWLGWWEDFFERDPESVEFWLRLVDAAEAATEDESRAELMAPLSINDDADDRDDRLASKNLFSPIGKLVGIFTAKLPNLEIDPNPFIEGGTLFQMRTRLLACTGPARDVVLYRFAEQLSYLLLADRAWTTRTLIDPLRSGDPAFRDLWVALSYHTLFRNTLECIGDAIIDRCLDTSLSRQVRENLVLSVVVECLTAYRDNRRKPSISKPRVVQMLRLLDDEARARAASILSRYVREVSENESGPDKPVTVEFLFDSSVQPFIDELWPKERSLSAPGIAKALADLPVIAHGRFAEAVAAIERYLVPFDCYSLYDFGFSNEDDEKSALNVMIGDPATAQALLRLLDLSIAHADQPVFPYELGAALSRIKMVDPDLAEDPRFLRLSMLMGRQ